MKGKLRSLHHFPIVDIIFDTFFDFLNSFFKRVEKLPKKYKITGKIIDISILNTCNYRI